MDMCRSVVACNMRARNVGVCVQRADVQAALPVATDETGTIFSERDKTVNSKIGRVFTINKLLLQTRLGRASKSDELYL